MRRARVGIGRAGAGCGRGLRSGGAGGCLQHVVAFDRLARAARCPVLHVERFRHPGGRRPGGRAREAVRGDEHCISHRSRDARGRVRHALGRALPVLHVDRARRVDAGEGLNASRGIGVAAEGPGEGARLR